MKWVVLTDVSGKTHIVNFERGVLEIVKGPKETKVMMANGTDFAVAVGEFERLRDTVIGKDMIGG